LDTIRNTDQWKLETPDKSDYQDDYLELEDYCQDTGTGTMVIWEKVDRLISPGNEKKCIVQLKHLSDELSAELSSIFSKFIDHTDDTYQNVNISIKLSNGKENKLNGWDPLCLNLNKDGHGSKVQRLKEKLVDVTLGNDDSKQFTISGSILPRQRELTRDEENDVRYTLDNQGFYIYREGRLIWHDGWPQRMYKKESKVTRLRVVLNFNHELDDLFKIDFRKSRIIIPKNVRDELKLIVSPWRNHTLKRDNNNKDNSNNSEQSNRHQSSNNAIGKHLDSTKNSEVTIEGDQALIRNKHNSIPTLIDGVKIYESNNVRVIEEDSLLGNALWDSGLDKDGNPCVLLGRSHPYFERMYAACKDQPDAIIALDMMLWSLSNAEYGTWSETNKIVMQEFRQHVSNSLNYLCQELPDPEED